MKFFSNKELINMEVIMEEKDKNQFLMIIKSLEELYSKKISNILKNIYWSSLLDYSIEEVSRSVFNYIKYSSNGQFMPKPCDIIKNIEGDQSDKALIAWSLLMKHIRRRGCDAKIEFEDDIISNVIEDMGGIRSISLCDEKQEPFKRSQFIAIYNFYLKKKNNNNKNNLLKLSYKLNNIKKIC